VADGGKPVAGQAVAHRWASRMDPGNLLYGTIVATAALAVEAARARQPQTRAFPVISPETHA